ncbi:hypothetical protein ACFX1T_014987 [Malus domestica]
MVLPQIVSVPLLFDLFVVYGGDSVITFTAYSANLVRTFPDVIHLFDLFVVVGDDGLRHAKSANDVHPYEAFYVRLSYGCYGLCFYPFREVIGCHDHHASTPSTGRH